MPRDDWFVESAGTLAATILIAAGVFGLFVSIGMVTHLVFSVVLKPGASEGYVVGTAIAAALIVVAAVLIMWSLGIRLSHLPRWWRRRVAGRTEPAERPAKAS